MAGSEKMKILPPTQRKKKRYVFFKVISDGPIVYSDLDSGIWNTMMDFHGELGASSSDMWIIKNTYDPSEQTGVVRCGHNSVPDVLSCLGLVERLGDTRVTINILKVSGTIKGLED